MVTLLRKANKYYDLFKKTTEKLQKKLDIPFMPHAIKTQF